MQLITVLILTMATTQGVIIRVNEKEIMQVLKSQVKTKGLNSYSRLLDTADTLQQIEEGNNTITNNQTPQPEAINMQETIKQLIKLEADRVTETTEPIECDHASGQPRRGIPHHKPSSENALDNGIYVLAHSKCRNMQPSPFGGSTRLNRFPHDHFNGQGVYGLRMQKGNVHRN